MLREWLLVAAFAMMTGCCVSAEAPLPLPAVRYFNPYQHSASWGGWGSAVYQSGGADVRNIGNALPVEKVGAVQALTLDAVNPVGGKWSAYLKVSGNPLNYLRVGAKPAIHLRLKWGAIPAGGAWNMTVQLNDARVQLRDYVTPSTSAWQDVIIPASDFKRASPNLDLTRVWSIGLTAAANYSERCLLYISAVEVLPTATPRPYAEFVKVNQIGYPTRMPSKMAIVSYPPKAVAIAPTWFQVVDTRLHRVVYRGHLVRVVARPQWAEDGDVVYHADFGSLHTPGLYCVETPQLHAASQTFRIRDDVYDRLFRDSLRFFYYSRAGEPIAEPFAEHFTRPAVHADSRLATYNYDRTKGHFDYSSNTTRDVHGCWFDAGDTHVDVPNTTTACWYLLETARDFGSRIRPGELNLPEMRAGRSDMAALIGAALDWLKRMQNPDGSVHQYVIGPDAVQRQQVSDISSLATAAAAAVYAKSYAVLRKSLPPKEAADLLHRARLAWSWLQTHPDLVRPRLPLHNGVDPGGDDQVASFGSNTAAIDRRLRALAAVELLEATGEAAFNDYFVDLFRKNGGTPLEGPMFGNNMTGYGPDRVLDYPNWVNFAFLDYLSSHHRTNAGVRSVLRAAFLHQADVLKRYAAANAYSIPLLYPGHLFWGSSGGVLAPSAMILIRAYEWTGNTEYRNAAANALHWICGRNTVDRLFVSGYGDYQHGSDFYSQFWLDLRHQPPGYLGGNINVEGSAKPSVEHPWKRFLNTQDADMTEPGVYWNSALAWMVGYFTANQDKKK